jgi:hypothetical protein
MIKFIGRNVPVERSECSQYGPTEQRSNVCDVRLRPQLRRRRGLDGRHTTRTRCKAPGITPLFSSHANG